MVDGTGRTDVKQPRDELTTCVMLSDAHTDEPIATRCLGRGIFNSAGKLVFNAGQWR